MDRRTLLKLTSAVVAGTATAPRTAYAQAQTPPQMPPAGAAGLWAVWDNAFARARYVSLSHVLTQDAPLWKGFPPTTKFSQGTGRLDDKSAFAAFTYEKLGLETTGYTFAADQFGTQLDPPAHWHQCYPAIDELPPTLAVRKLAVISIATQVAADPAYHLSLEDVRAWERRHGAVPAGSVLMIRSDWYKRWPDKARFQPADNKFPGVRLEALKYLHLDRKILLHGHEPLDTDATPTLLAEDWLMNNGFMQAEGVANLDQVPETGALVAIGYPRLKGGTGGFASFTAVCPPEWTQGVRPGDTPEGPLPYSNQRLVWNEVKGVRERTAPCDKPEGKLSFN